CTARSGAPSGITAVSTTSMPSGWRPSAGKSSPDGPPPGSLFGGPGAGDRVDGARAVSASGKAAAAGTDPDGPGRPHGRPRRERAADPSPRSRPAGSAPTSPRRPAGRGAACSRRRGAPEPARDRFRTARRPAAVLPVPARAARAVRRRHRRRALARVLAHLGTALAVGGAAMGGGRRRRAVSAGLCRNSAASGPGNAGRAGEAAAGGAARLAALSGADGDRARARTVSGDGAVRRAQSRRAQAGPPLAAGRIRLVREEAAGDAWPRIGGVLGPGRRRDRPGSGRGGGGVWP